MNKLQAFIKILRPLNLILSLLSVFIAAFLCEAISSPLLPFTAMVVLSFAGASNILNDVLDIHTDEINRPLRILPSGRMKITEAVLFMAVLYGVGILSAFYLHPLGRNMGLIIVLPLLVLYTPLFKGIPLIGNLVVAAALGMVFLFTEAALTGEITYMIVPFLLAMALSFIRELIKDAEDLEGDTQIQLRTFPNTFGIPATLSVLRIVSILLCIGAIFPWLEGWYGLPYLLLLIGGVELPLIYFIFFKLSSTSGNNDFSHSASGLKIITVAGMAVILASGV
ncbi:MAG: UbiA family prenyltransferase [Candidatus Marinimicrobia bacterium]|nr:UbiA family prenyltransferase [Candidatus Neomarinimicrobiota bacterium]MDP6852505.1 UbiA family prenyltransferase [Candidatus Neomarinimicrobiota bacterium]MDP6936044.1 UbiA family prenyltransferase [Candidatus Neomarinimicrobiota bacterium]